MNQLSRIFCGIVLFFAMIGFSQCKKDTAPNVLQNGGFVNYQYFDTTISAKGDTSIAQVYTVFPLSQAYFIIDTTISLAGSLDTIFRPIALTIYSAGCVYGNVHQPVGSSVVKISLIDSIKKQAIYPADGLTPFVYSQSNLNAFNSATSKKPVWLSINGNMELQNDTLFTTTFSGVNTRINSYINILYVGNNGYQVIASGTYNGLAFNVSYSGSIIRKF